MGYILLENLKSVFLPKNKVIYLRSINKQFANLFLIVLLNLGPQLHPGSYPRGLRFNTSNDLLGIPL